jgi:biopolymer transport protein ExbD
VSGGGGEDGPIVAINVTPLVDVVLVLLVILMVSTPLLAERVLPMHLPKASTGTEEVAILSIELGSDGRVVANQIPIDGEEGLARVVQASRAEHPDLKAVIRADGAVPHGRVIRVMDVLRQGGISQMTFAVDALGESPGRFE